MQIPDLLAKRYQLRMAMRSLIAQATITSWIGLTDEENTNSEVALPERVKLSRSCALRLIHHHFFNHYFYNGFLRNAAKGMNMLDT